MATPAQLLPPLFLVLLLPFLPLLSFFLPDDYGGYKTILLRVSATNRRGTDQVSNDVIEIK